MIEHHIMDAAPETTRSIFRKKLCFKSTLDTCEYDKVANIYFRNVNVTTPSKEATVSPKADDDLHDFKSPTKAAIKPKKPVKRRQKMPTRPYSYPDGCANTQEMFETAWMRASVEQTEYASENEFEIFKDERKREALLRSKAEFRNKLASARVTESFDQQTEKLNSIEAKPTPLESILPLMDGCSIESGGVKTPVESSKQKVTNADNLVTSSSILLPTHCSSTNDIATSNYKKKSTDCLRSELRNIKIVNVIIPDSELSEDEVGCSQLPSSEKMKTGGKDSSSENKELKSLKDLEAYEELLCATKSPSIKPKLASSLIPLKTECSHQLEVNKTNRKNEMVALSDVYELAKTTAEFKREPTLNLQNAKIHPTHSTCPLVIHPLRPSIEQYAKSEWRVETLTTAVKPSQKSSKVKFDCKKSRFPYIRSLRRKKRMFKQKRVTRLI